jgi:undecaprenyl pyrophosphate phosphatase UppP
MVRSIIAVIVSYITMFVLNFLAFVGLYTVLGPNQAFRPHSYLASTRWIAISLVIIFVTAVIGGLICSAIAKGGRAPLALAIVVLVLGLLLAVPSLMKAKANADLIRIGDVPQMEAAQKAYWPVWTPFTFPFISAIGVLIGGRLKRRS